MERNDFDKMLRDRLERVTEPAPDVWEGIDRELTRRHRRILFRRFSIGAVAAAASLAVALLVYRDLRPERHVEAPVTTVAEVQQESSSEPAAVEIAPIAEQISRLGEDRLVAQAKTAHAAMADQSGTPISAEPVQPVQPVQPSEEPVKEPVAEPAEETVVSVEPANPVENEDGKLSMEDLPEDFWREDVPDTKAHTSTISILSNLTTVASDGDLIYRASPMHSSSQSGSRQATSLVEPVSGTPKFFSPFSLGLQIEFPLAGSVYASTGLTYSYLVSQYDMLVDKQLFEGSYNQLHYLGVPLSLSWHFVESPSFALYASAGGAVEKCIYQRYVFGSNTLHEKVGGLQWSARIGLGAEYWMAPRLGLYFDPSLVYFFDNGQPLSIRTQQPLQARFEIGLRFKL
ncbi:MAG: hypothetical protein IJK90_05565 [Bacteroidales bacterium]|nr:hypothetical protein [Bacteroidales bacterium]